MVDALAKLVAGCLSAGAGATGTSAVYRRFNGAECTHELPVAVTWGPRSTQSADEFGASVRVQASSVLIDADELTDADGSRLTPASGDFLMIDTPEGGTEQWTVHQLPGQNHCWQWTDTHARSQRQIFIQQD